MRSFRQFSYKDTNLRVCCDLFDELVAEVVDQRKVLERYIRAHGGFADALLPVAPDEDAPEVVVRMTRAAAQTGIGPMAGVAGTLAQMGVEKALLLGASEAIVENGGDMYIAAAAPVTIGIFSGDSQIGNSLAFRIEPSTISICSSSSKMGHSFSTGNCNLATVVSADGALADCAATLLCNSIRSAADLQGAIERVTQLTGVDGALAIVDGNLGLGGRLPALVKNQDADVQTKITSDRRAYMQIL